MNMSDSERMKNAQEEVMALISENPSLSLAEMALFAYLNGYRDGCLELLGKVSCEIAILKAKTAEE